VRHSIIIVFKIRRSGRERKNKLWGFLESRKHRGLEKLKRKKIRNKKSQRLKRKRKDSKGHYSTEVFFSFQLIT